MRYGSADNRQITNGNFRQVIEDVGETGSIDDFENMKGGIEHMRDQSEWAEDARSRSISCWKDFITSRVETSLERVSRNPEYKVLKGEQDKSKRKVDKLLMKLNKKERMIVQEHYENETVIENYELEEAYWQGIRDGIRFLSWLDIFQVKRQV